jgi:Putative esterase
MKTPTTIALMIALALAVPSRGATRFEISFPASVHATPVTGRLFLIFAHDGGTEPRLQQPLELLGVDVRAARPDEPAVMDGDTPGFPARTLGGVPPGDYFVQAVLNVYSEFPRADGHTIWAHMDQWEGQQFESSPGNLVSEPQRFHLDSAGGSFKVNLIRVIPPIQMPADSAWVRRIKFESKLLTRFWGHPIYIGATVLLPKDYEAHPGVHYPVIYLQGHFSMDAPFGFTTEPDPAGSRSWARQREEWAAHHLNNMPEPPPGSHYNGALMNVESGYEFFQAWNSDNFPRMIAVTFQHPTPYFDDSYGVNSPNAGPYGDAIMNELIPAVEARFRTIRQPYARVLTGGSTGGWGALAMQLYHPDFFGGTWSFYPDPVDFRRYYGGVDLYKDDNAFADKPGRYFAGGGQGNRRNSQRIAILGTEDGAFEWDKLTPVGADGYPRPVWDLATGKIDREVVESMKDHDYDLREFLERNWSSIGPKLVGKLHVICGDEDGGFANLAVYLLEDFLEGTKQPNYNGSFQYGRPLKGHGWQPTTNAELVRTMATYIISRAPAPEKPDVWQYK